MTDNRSAGGAPPERMGFDGALARAAEAVGGQLTAAPPFIRALTRHLARAQGKFIRAQSLLACALRADGSIHPDAVPLASAVELLHLATLVHDDVIDGAGIRRGIETLHRKYGEKNAVLCGDYLLCLALSLASTISEHEERRGMPGERAALPRYLTDICLGELRQNQNNRRFDLSERAYMQTISGKTASLFELSFYCGFLLSDSPSEAKSGYTALGRNLGLIFQLSDDCLDYEGTQQRAKKPVLSDFRAGVVTLPLIYALKHDAALLGELSGGISDKRLQAAVSAAGGLRYTHAKIARLYEASIKALNRLDGTDEKRARIASLLALSAGV